MSPVDAKSEKPRVSKTSVILVAAAGGLVSGVVGVLGQRWLHGSILPAVLGGVLAGVIGLIFERQARRAKARR